jgi:UDP-2,4-diacetamido-2,4,6-trideoxy-beta-L-altropyranose hydrolase
MQVVFRVDSSAQIGTGHMARCLTLANALRERGKSTGFVSRQITPGMERLLVAHGHALLRLPEGREKDVRLAHAHWLGASQSEDARATAVLMPDSGCEWLVVDHYGLDAEWEKLLRPHARLLLAIDDLADRSHVCDMLLDQNLQPKGSDRYAGLMTSGCRQLIGPRYALLRPEFRKLADSQPRTRDRVNIFFGGTDPDGMTVRAAEGLAQNDMEGLAADIVVGQDNPHRDRIAALVKRLPSAVLHIQPQNLATLMSRAVLALGAGGATSWERCCLRLPTLLVSIADNQKSGCQALAAARAGLYLGDMVDVTARRLTSVMRRVLSRPGLLAAMSRRAAALVDGQGTARVVEEMLCG